MDDRNDRPIKLRKYFQAKDMLHHHRPWFIYTTAVELEQPFSLQELQNAIYKQVGVRPQINRLLKETREFYEQHDIPIISRKEPGTDSFTVNQEIDLDNPRYRTIIQPPYEHPGRPRKKYTQGEKQIDSGA